MSWRNWVKRIYSLVLPGFGRDLRRGHKGAVDPRGPVTHVLILDGTMSSLVPGDESNAGLVYRLLSEVRGARMSLYYEAGLQWQDWRGTISVMMGRGINRQIRRAYGYLSSRYRPGDRIYLLGYSRGAYAVRSLAGAIDMVGLLRGEHATERNVRLAWRHYQSGPERPVARAFHNAYCHEAVPIEMVGVWDTVKALGLRLPILWRWSAPSHAFHSHQLGRTVRRGYHALALDETRIAYRPVLWQTGPETAADVQQVWFRGTHADIGGHLSGFDAARPLANIPLVWMLERGEAAGLTLPQDWRARYPCDASAPSVGTWGGWGKIFLARGRRTIGRDPSERVHETAYENGEAPPVRSGAL
ncbi:hypothetical protein DC366_14435 [Pelagivirga sediminicola]|uniref:T6SS Phospholipase effector Tle1-like catalytic domain-containing protein n=1 Tax=Pelagivirga sediminicola TaxID=2170575 RepID=A0A2T7G4R1_9RHOB|nr:DUF2235 domain-containing protein [Pelagivirga sediminicola]PVA09376.1 hypothetical protein DC366_14435 [Pelagivirga sediminicola]